VYYAKPFHHSIVSKGEFDNGAQYYPGTYEFWAWCNIPGEAILCTVSLRDLGQAIEEDPELCALLRLRTLMTKRKFLDTQRQDLAADDVQLSSAVVSATARLALLLGVNSRWPIELRHIVSDLIEGWKIVAGGFRTPETWLALANTFSHAMTRNDTRAPTLRQQEALKVAFLEGVRWGLAKPNSAHTEISALQKRWRVAGLDSVDLILKQEVHELTNIHQRLVSTTQKRTRELQMYADQRAVSKMQVMANGNPLRAQVPDRSRGALEMDEDLYDHDAHTEYLDEPDWRDVVVQRMR
jgi:hypothetical protein